MVDLGRKTWRRWWLVAVFAVAGGGLSLALATTRPRSYVSSATLFYQEQIQSQVLSPGRLDVAQRSLGDRYRELLLARGQLDQIINDPSLDPFPLETDPELKIDKLRQTVRFVGRGAMAFRIEYSDSEPDRARRVADKLTRLLQDTDEALRNEQAAATVAFVTRQKQVAATELRSREAALNEFFANHPEFAQDPRDAASCATRTAPAPTLSVKQRQLNRIKILLSTPPGTAPPVQLTPERQQAQEAIATAEREVKAAQAALDGLRQHSYTDEYPSVKAALGRLATAQQVLLDARAAVPPEVRPATAQDRAKLVAERDLLEAELRDEQRRTGKTAEPDTTTQRVVQLENESSSLRREVTEQRERVRSLADSEFRALLDASQKLAEQGGRLSVVDPAGRPVRPTGPGRRMFLMAGMVVFLTLGLSLAIGLAVVDDRLYRRVDLDQLGVAVLGVIPPAAARTRKRAAAGTRPGELP